MNKNTFFAISAILLLNCQNPKAKNPPPAPTEIDLKTELPTPAPTATNSTDYLGIYKGTLPCADCQGIETSLELSEDFSYTIVRKYIGKSDKPIESGGTFRWDADGKRIRLDNAKDSNEQYLVGDRQLTKLDNEGAVIGGKSANRYILRKITDGAAEKLPVPRQEQSPQEIAGIRWKLVEINGHTLQAQGEKPYYIELDAMNAFTGFAGCNSLRGHYETRENRIRFMRIVGTMKGCPQLPTEEKFKTVLGSVNNFVRNGNILQFRDGEAFIAKFEATAK